MLIINLVLLSSFPPFLLSFRVSHILATDDFHYFPPAISEFNV